MREAATRESLEVNNMMVTTEAIGILASFVEKTEHLEDNKWELHPKDNVATIINNSNIVLSAYGFDIFEEYQAVMDSFERGHFFDGLVERYFDDDLTIRSWRMLQILQMKHDQAYHPDVVGPGNEYHLGHTLLHLASTNGKVAKSLRNNEPFEKRIKSYTNLAVFGVKAAGTFSIELPEHDGMVSV